MPFKILVLCNVLLLTAGQAAAVRNRQDSESQNTNEKTARNEPDASGENNQNKSASRLVLKASKLRECSVYGPDEEKLGTTIELVVDLRAGRVRYAVLSYGGFMGIGEKLFAVPLDATDPGRSIDRRSIAGLCVLVAFLAVYDRDGNQ